MQIEAIKESDKQLRDAVLVDLRWDPAVVSTDISLIAEDDVVTLTWFVHTYPEKFAAEYILCSSQRAYG